MNRNSIGRAKAGDPIFDSCGNKVGHVSVSDSVAVFVSLEGIKEPLRLARAFFAADRERIRPSKKTLAAMPGLRDATLYFNRGK